MSIEKKVNEGEAGSGYSISGTIRTARILGIIQAGVMIAATIGVSTDAAIRPTSSSAHNLSGLTGYVIVMLLMGGLILVASLRLTKPRTGPSLVLLLLEIALLIGVLAFIGIVVEITVPLALAIIVCLSLPVGIRQNGKRRQIRANNS